MPQKIKLLRSRWNVL